MIYQLNYGLNSFILTKSKPSTVPNQVAHLKRFYAYNVPKNANFNSVLNVDYIC